MLSFSAIGEAGCRDETQTTTGTTTSSTTQTGGAGGSETGGAGGTGATGGSETGGTGGTGAGGMTGGTGGTGAGGMTGGTGGMGTGGMTGGTGGMGTGGMGGMGTGGMGTGGMGGMGGMGTGGMGTGGAGGGIVGACSADSGPPEILTLGTPGKLLLQGCIITPDDSFDGQVLVESDTITCVAADCSSMPGATGASVVATHGIIAPGLIDAHNHILFDIFDETDWTPTQAYQNHNQWTNEARYGAVVDAKQYLNGESGSPVSVGCEMNKYGELKGLIAGTTSILGAANPANKTCYGSLSRTIDQSPNDLGQDKVQVATLFPSTSAADGVCNNVLSDNTDAYAIHIAEGVDATSLNEFATLGTVTTTDNCLYTTETTIVHGTALGDAQFTTMAQNGMSLVWSPRSNVFLYGSGTDLTKTTNIPLVLQKGITVALGPDWSLGGSQNMLDEMRFADLVDNAVFGDILTVKDIVTMATKNGAAVLGLSATLGTITAGKKADLLILGGDTLHPWDAVLAATPADVRLVLVGGMPLYGSDELGMLGPAAPGCEALDVCGAMKFVCVAEAGGTTTNKFGQSLAEIINVLQTELTAYDNLNLTQWDFAPITPLVKCP
ncbi:MAG: amidohydrolase family protein [Polyangiaceae bacterium]|nr:amidohydrolase family protein [Polyangiaceae bacterium]